MHSHELDIQKVSSNAVRNLLGRGSFSTIQKYIDILRVEARAAEAPQLESAPGATLGSVGRAVVGRVERRAGGDAVACCTAYCRSRRIEGNSWRRRRISLHLMTSSTRCKQIAISTLKKLLSSKERCKQSNKQPGLRSMQRVESSTG